MRGSTSHIALVEFSPLHRRFWKQLRNMWSSWRRHQALLHVLTCPSVNLNPLEQDVEGGGKGRGRREEKAMRGG